MSPHNRKETSKTDIFCPEVLAYCVGARIHTHAASSECIQKCEHPQGVAISFVLLNPHRTRRQPHAPNIHAHTYTRRSTRKFNYHFLFIIHANTYKPHTRLRTPTHANIYRQIKIHLSSRSLAVVCVPFAPPDSVSHCNAFDARSRRAAL